MPEVTPDTKPFWEGANRGELSMQQCRSCGRYQFYPREHCIHCGTRELDWTVLSGRGIIYSYTVTMRAANDAFEAPYVVAIVELDEGPRMLTNVVDCKISEVGVGASVRAEFVPMKNGTSLPVFRLV